VGGTVTVIQSGSDGVLNCLRLLQDLCIPKPQHPEACSLQPCGPLRIVLHLCRMVSPVHLNDQPLLETDEINDICPKGLLTTKPAPAELPETQMPPQEAFSLCRMRSQPSGGGAVHPPIPTFPRTGGKECSSNGQILKGSNGQSRDAFQAKHAVGHHGLLKALDGERADVDHIDQIPNQLARSLADDDLAGLRDSDKTGG